MALALLVTGAGGLLGRSVLHAVADQRNVFARGFTSRELDLTDPGQVRHAFDLWARVVQADDPKHRLVALNAAAYTAVDDAEHDEERAFAVNATGPALLARACHRTGARLLQVSTDYVFDGRADRPYEVDDDPAPQSVYGRSKLAGEQAVRLLLPDAAWVVRTAWLYGADDGFVATMARRAVEGGAVDVVEDQQGSPTAAADLAGGLLELARSDVSAGIYHCTNSGQTTWYGLARGVYEELGADPAMVRPTTAQELGRAAVRPASSVLSDRAWRAAGLNALPPWRDALSRTLRASRWGPAQPV